MFVKFFLLKFFKFVVKLFLMLKLKNLVFIGLFLLFLENGVFNGYVVYGKFFVGFVEIFVLFNLLVKINGILNNMMFIELRLFIGLVELLVLFNLVVDFVMKLGLVFIVNVFGE